MRTCEITVFSHTGQPVGGGGVQLPDRPEPLDLDGLRREWIDGVPCCYATVRAGRTALAVFLAAPYVPRAAVRLDRARRSTGRWLTSALSLGSPGLGSAWVGPRTFLRQLDVGGSDAWLATVLMHLHADLPVRVHDYGRPLYEWELGGSRYYYTAQGASFQLYGGGNTPAARVDDVIRQENPVSASAYLWSVGAVRVR